jgi:branched-subunit amino acid transport protein AzlD
MSESYLATALAVLALGNLLTRAAPFLFFARRKPPRAILFVERNFPPIILTILVFYTLGGVKFSAPPYGVPVLLAVAATILLHAWRGNYLLSIFGGTAFYMLLLRLI